MSKKIIELLFIFIIFFASFTTSMPAGATSTALKVEIIITNKVNPLVSSITHKRLRIVDHSGLIIVPKVKTKQVEAVKPAVKVVPKVVEKAIAEKKPETKASSTNPKTKLAPKTEPKIELETTPQTTQTPEKAIKTDIPDAVASSIPKELFSVAQVQDLIRKYSQKYELDPEMMLKLADCESRFKTDIVTLGRYYGVYQFSGPTFKQYSKELKIENPDPLDPEQNIEVAAYMIQNGQIGRWGCKV